ncbi:MAG: PucR family transcriptional regulator [Candidatus Aquicultorales bacterium]
MSTITLQDVLGMRSLKDSVVLTGAAKLDRLVTGVTVGEVPDIANWLTGGELVLSTFFAVSRDSEAVRSFAEKILTGPAAALAVKPARFLEAIPSEVLRLAEKLDFPVIEVPSGTRWTSIIADVYKTLAQEEAEARLAGDIFHDLAAGRIPGHQIAERIKRLGGDVTKGYQIMVCAFDSSASGNVLFREALRAVRNEESGSPVMEYNGRLTVVFGGAGRPTETAKRDLSKLAAKVRAITEAAGGKAAIGISRWWEDSRRIATALDEATTALDYIERLGGKPSIVDFDNLGVYRLLLPLVRESKADGRAFYDETVGFLDEYDKAHSTELVATLESFKRNNENVALAAEELFAHRHTVRYRLQRIHEITGCDPFASPDREKLYMGLHLKYLLNL